MVASVHPGCCGVAARLPKKPGTQKLTPPSSACATPGRAASIAIDRPAPVYLRMALSPRLNDLCAICCSQCPEITVINPRLTWIEGLVVSHRPREAVQIENL